jgi:prevent-host-death family protein
MTTVGVRALKNRLSQYLRRAAEGERLTVTDRGRPVAILGPPEERDEDQQLRTLVREGLARWAGGKPRMPRRPVRIRGKPISDTVREGRR